VTHARHRDGNGKFDLDAFIAQHNIAVRRAESYQGGRRLILENCVFDPAHTGTSAAIFESASGALGYRCLHNSCSGKHWLDLREFFAPGYYERRTAVPQRPVGSQEAAPAVRYKGSEGTSSPWDNAQAIDEFLVAVESAAQLLVDDILARESVTVLASPRGLGKTHLAYYWAVTLAGKGLRVLIIDRDNPKREIRRRLPAWGAASLGDQLKVIARDEAPPLTDKAAWAIFPYTAYDLVILDSISASTEGVDQGDGGAAGAGLAPLLDAARKGPAVLVLANTDKAGLKIRDSGVLSDRVDVVYEVRDATDLTVTAKHGAWWDALLPAGEEAWGDRAKRRRRRDSYWLGLIPSKFRIGEWPDPRALEIHHNTEPWSVTDITAELEQKLERAKRAAADAEQAKLDAAAAELAKHLPIAKTTDAIETLRKAGLGRNSARRLIEERLGRDWQQVGAGSKTDPVFLELPAGILGSQNPSPPRVSNTPIPAAIGAQGRQESPSQITTPPMGSDPVNSCRLTPQNPPANPESNLGDSPAPVAEGLGGTPPAGIAEPNPSKKPGRTVL
jgi:hypothetical protein